MKDTNNTLGCLMQQALGEDWHRLPPALQAHHRGGEATDVGELSIEFPAHAWPLVQALRLLGALVWRNGQHMPTTVSKLTQQGRQRWQRSIQFPGGRTVRFNSVWTASSTPGCILEFVNPVLGLEMQPYVAGQDLHNLNPGAAELHYRGLRFVAKLGSRVFTLPSWMGLGRMHIREWALDERRFAMDFTLEHALLGRWYRYCGQFTAAVAASPSSPAPPGVPLHGGLGTGAR